VLGFVPILLCRGVRELELCTTYLYYCNSLLEVLWKVLGGYSENPSVWRRGRRVVARTSKCIFVFAFGSLCLSTLYSLYILHCYYCSYLYMLDIVCVLKLVFNQESYWNTSTHNLEKSWGEVPEPFTENSTSLLVINCALAFNF